MPSPKKPFIDDKTIVPAEMLSSIFGGLDGYKTSNPPSPFYNGHIHDDGNEWGHAPKIDLTTNITGRLVMPLPDLKSIKLSATEASPLTSSLFWTLPIPSDAYSITPEPMFLKIYWSANGSTSPGSVAFRIDWTYLQAGQNVIPPSIIGLGSSSWPTNTVAGNNAIPTTFRFGITNAVTASILYVNDTTAGTNVIPLTLPPNAPSAVLTQFLLLGLEITTAPTVTLLTPMNQVNIYAIELLYYSSVIGDNATINLLSNNPGLSDF